MKKKTMRVTALIVLLMMVLSVSADAAVPGIAEPYSNAYINSTFATISSNNGTLKVSFTAYGTGTMTMIGASTVKIYQVGVSSPVKTYYSIYGYNCMTYSDSVPYSGTSGERYYAVVKFYAKNSSGSGTASFTTSTITA